MAAVGGETHHDENYAKNLALCLNDFRRKNIMCDVILISSPKEFLAHRNILCAASPYFLELFSTPGNAQPTLGSRVELRDISHDVIEDVLNFIYLGEICVGEENVTKLIAASDILHMSNLKDIACRFYEKKLCPSNCLSIASLADKFNCISLREAADKFVFLHFMEVCQYHEFKTLSCPQVVRILSSDDIVVDREETVYVAVMDWIYFDFDTRKQYLKNMLKCVRFVQTSKYFISDVIDQNSVIRSDSSCMEIIESARYVLNFPDRKHLIKFPESTLNPRKCFDLTEVIIACGGNQDRISSHEVLCYVPENDFWYPLAPLHYSRYQSASVVFHDGIYCIGGKVEEVSSKHIEKYVFFSDKWSSYMTTPAPICNHAAIVFNGDIYILGGEVNGRSIDQVLRFSTQLSKWVKVSNMKIPRRALAIVGHKKIYAIGGYGSSNAALASVECFDPYINQWSKLFPMNSPRAGASAVCTENNIFVFGGEYAMWSYYRSAEVFNIMTDEWRNIADISVPRAYMGIFYHQDQIYLVGGMVSAEGSDQYGAADDDDEFVDVNESKLVECYSIAGNSYKRMCSLPLPTAAINCCVVTTSKTLLQTRCGL